MADEITRAADLADTSGMTPEQWVRHLANGWGGSSGEKIAVLMAEYDRRGTELERLRARTHEIQAQEMAKRAHLDSLIAKMRARWDAAKRWTEDNELLAEWASGTARPFWSMTSTNARDALARLVTDRADALAEVERLRVRVAELEAIERRADEVSTWCGDRGMHRAVSYVRTGLTGDAAEVSS